MNGKSDVGLRLTGQFLLGVLGRFLQSLERHLVLAEVDAVALLELVGDVVDERFVEVVAAQVRVAVRRQHVEDALGDVEDGDVERTAAQVEDRDLFVLLLVEPVCQRGRRRLVDDAHDLKTGDLAGVLGRLSLAVVEVRGNGDDRLLDLVAKVGFGGFLQLAKDHRRNFGRRELLVVDLHLDEVVRPADDRVRNEFLFRFDLVVPPTHESLDRVDRAPRVRHRLPFGRFADESLALVGEADDARRERLAFLVGDDLDVLAFKDRHDGVRRAEVDADDLFAFRHCVRLLLPPHRTRRVDSSRGLLCCVSDKELEQGVCLRKLAD